MRRLYTLAACLVLGVVVTAAGAHGQDSSAVRSWEKYVARDRSWSFHDPKGWTAKPNGPIVEVTQPLTAMAAQSISEMLAYSHLLQEQPNAMPSDVAAESVAEQKQRIIAAWKALPTEARDAVTGSPGLWVTMRALLHYGTPEDQQRARDRILQMTVNSQAAHERGSTDITRKLASNMIKHNVMMDIQRQTFNTYMWSHGFNYSRTAGKLW